MYRTKTEIRLILMLTPGPEGKSTRGSASFRNKRRAMGPNECFVLYIEVKNDMNIYATLFTSHQCPVSIRLAGFEPNGHSLHYYSK